VIVILYPQFHAVGGIARYLDAFLANLPADAPEVVLVTGDDVGSTKTYRGVRFVHIPVLRSRLGLLLWSWRARRLVAALDRRQGVAALHLHIPPLIPGLFAGMDIPLVLTAHTTYLGMSGRFDGNRNFQSPWNALSLWLKIRIEHLIFARADTVITLTEQGRRELTLYGRTEGVVVIPNGVHLAEFTPDAAVEKNIDVIFSGRIERRKGSRPLVDVCRRLVADHPLIRIAVVGYGDDEAHVWRELADLSDNVLLTGKVSFGEMVSYYQRSAVYASTSYYEGLPGTCLEAMAMGLPVVAWDLLFYRALVIKGVTGLVEEVNDIAAMTRAIARLLEDKALARTMGQAGRAIVHDRYDWRRLAAQVLRACDGVPALEATTEAMS